MNELNQDFFKRLDNPDTLRIEITPDALKNVLTKEIKFKDLNERLLKSRQEKVIVREVVLESEIEFVNSLKQLKVLFKEELKTAMDRVNDLYTSELLKLQKIYKEEIIGTALIQIVKEINKSGWVLLMKDSGVFAYKCYSPGYEVLEGHTDKNVIKDFEEPVCTLRGIYVNILHPQITYGTILLATEGQHPNCDKAKFGTACIGTFEDRDIPLDNPYNLLCLLNEISATYEICHLGSAYYTPTINSTNRKDEKWKATGT
jgi:hypothetical protein